MPFHPPDVAVPDVHRTPRLVLRPLRVSDAQRDYDAVMSSAALLRRWSGTAWPADDFTLEENRADLERHEREHEAREAFTFTVLEPDEARCLGCVYLGEPWPEERPLCAGAAWPVRAAFWVRASEVEHDLDAHLLDTLRTWLVSAWAFDRALFTIARDERRQADLLAAAGLAALGAIRSPDGRPCRVFA